MNNKKSKSLVGASLSLILITGALTLSSKSSFGNNHDDSETSRKLDNLIKVKAGLNNCQDITFGEYCTTAHVAPSGSCTNGAWGTYCAGSPTGNKFHDNTAHETQTYVETTKQCAGTAYKCENGSWVAKGSTTIGGGCGDYQNIVEKTGRDCPQDPAAEF